MSGMVTLYQSAVEGSIVSLLTGKTASVRRQACLGRLEARRVLEEVKSVAILIITELYGLKEQLRMTLKTRKTIKKVKGNTTRLIEMYIFLPKVVDSLKLYAIYSYCSTLDGLSMIFKIVNNNRREHFMVRTIFIMMLLTTFLHNK